MGGSGDPEGRSGREVWRPEGNEGRRRHRKPKIDPRLKRWGITVVPVR